MFGTLLSVPPVEASHRLEGKADIDVGNGEWVIAVPLPGHTPGSYVYLFDGVLFAGDALLAPDRYLGMTDTFIERVLASLRSDAPGDA